MECARCILEGELFAMSRPRTLLELLEEYSIEVPRVQRDYVQGRMDEHSRIVRANLLKDIKQAYEGSVIPPNTKPEPLDLNFIYGKTTKGKVFYPVDGQQRLTTLFLLHLFAFADDDTKTEKFLRFSYQARTTTRDFFEELICHRKEVFSSSESPKAVVTDAAWFIDSWKYDPSVKNALNTLNDICSLGLNVANLKNQLEEKTNPKVYFQFVELDKLGMEDDLYIKLNARGRALTSFEIFKSRFVDRCIDACANLADEFKKRLDGLWTDYIWKIGEDEFDAIYLRYFETIFLNTGLLMSEANKVVSKNWVYNIKYEDISGEVFTITNNMLNYLSANTHSLANEIVKVSISKPTPYPNKVLFHAVYVYLSDENDVSKIDIHAFSDWLRVFVNLVNNSRIEEVDVYKRAIQSINGLKAHKKDLLQFLAAGKINDLPGFLKEQFDEECQKARIMCKDATHKKMIIDAENALPYFSGQIRSILFYSEFEKTDNYADFERLLGIEKVLFDKEKPIHGKRLRKALCAIGDYRLPVGNYKTLCIDDPNESSRTWSIKRLFSNHGKEVKELLDLLDVTKPIDSQLDSIAASKTIDQDDWRYCFVKYMDILYGRMSTSHLRMVNNTYEELIVPNKQSNGENYSVYLLVLQHLLKKVSISSEYHTELGANGDRYLEVKNCKVRFRNKKFYIENDTGTWSSTRKDVIDEVIVRIESIL